MTLHLAEKRYESVLRFVILHQILNACKFKGQIYIVILQNYL